MKSLLRFIGASLLALSSNSSFAVSVVLNHAPNNMGLTGTLSGGFYGATSADIVGNQSFGYGADPDVYGLSSSQTISISGVPTSGSGTIDATITGGVTYGTLSTNDIFNFNISATASALTAQNSAGENADAIINATLSADFLPDSSFSPLPTLAYLGSVNLSALPAVSSYESLSIKVFENGVNILTMSAGDAMGSFDVFNDSIYSVQLAYNMTIPFGIDPTAEYFITGEFIGADPVKTSPVPVPPALLLFLSGLLPVFSRLRRK